MANTIKCRFAQKRCLCQWCEKPCNNGKQCYECDMAGKAEHDTYMCTSFVGTYPEGFTSEDVHRKAEEYMREITNFERITASPAALAAFLANNEQVCDMCDTQPNEHGMCGRPDKCQPGIVAWLEREADDNERQRAGT